VFDQRWLPTGMNGVRDSDQCSLLNLEGRMNATQPAAISCLVANELSFSEQVVGGGFDQFPVEEQTRVKIRKAIASQLVCVGMRSRKKLIRQRLHKQRKEHGIFVAHAGKWEACAVRWMGGGFSA